MKALLVTVLLGSFAVATAHELDNERTVSAEQIALAKDLPATTVVRVSQNDPKQVEIATSKTPLKPGDKIENLKFVKVALNAEASKLALDSGNELDATSSTSSWVVGWGGRGRGYGYAYGRRPYAGYGRGYGYGYYGNGYGYGGGYGYNGGYGYEGGYGYNGGYNNYDEAINGGAEYYPGAYGEPRWNSYNGGVASSEYQKNGCLTNYSCPEAFYPSYQYSGYNYDYAPYHTFSNGGYDYAYTGWGY